MKLLPDRDGEEFVLENDWEMAIPISFLAVNGELTVSYYPSCETETQAFLAKHASDPFSAAALADLYALFHPFLEKYGYKDDRFRDRWGYIYRGTGDGGESRAIRLAAEDEKYNDTTYDIEASVEDGRLAYGILDGGRVVSVAVTHEPIDGETALVEIGVETVPRTRRRGYAVQAVRALVAELARRGIATEYRCQRYNAASRKVAERAGLLPVGKYYYYVGRK